MKLPTKQDIDRTRLTRSMVEFALYELRIDHTASPKEANMRCPFHDDGDKPSLYMNLDRKVGVYHCFAARCGVRGSFTEFIRKYTGWTEVKTLQYAISLRKRLNVKSNVDAGAEIELPSQRHGAIQYDVSALDSYKHRHPYLYERGLIDSTLDRFNIGFDKAENKITFPWFDRTGKLVAIKRRDPDKKFYSYPKDVDLRHTLFGLNLVRPHGIVWITEGEFDAMALDQAFRLAHFDFHFAVALGGSTLHETQVTALLKCSPAALVDMLDNDAGGREAAKAVRRIVGGSVRFTQGTYPDASVKDPGGMTFEQILNTTLMIEKQLAA